MKLLNFIKKNVLLVAAFATVIGFSAFKATKATTNYYKLVGSEYRMVDFESGDCQPLSSETCLWIIESEDLTIPVNQANNPQPHLQGEFDGEFATE